MEFIIYFGNRKLIAAQHPPQGLVNKPSGRVQVISDTDEETIKQAVDAIRNGEAETIVLLHPEPAAVVQKIKTLFQFIQAAGGLVLNDEGCILLIYRNKKWDLPKGKLDPGEDLDACAVREVQEETGLKTVSIKQPIGITLHTYFQASKHCLKESHWYLMHTEQTENLKPQTEEGIEQCIWVHPADLSFYLQNTHPSIADILHSAVPMMQ